MNKKALLALAATLAAGATAVTLFGRKAESGESAQAAPASPVPVDSDETVAFPLKNKYTDFSRGESDPIYRFELDTPGGVKEIAVSAEQYETYYIGDEVICMETGRELRIV